MVPGEEHTHPSPISARCTELYSRQRIQITVQIGDWTLKPLPKSTGTMVLWKWTYLLPDSPISANVITVGDQIHFMQDWSAVKGFANPPWNLVPRVLNQVQTQETDIVLVTPLWKAQPWYALLLSMLVDWPCPLPQQELLTSMGEVSLSPPRLVAWSISGNPSKAKAFLSRLQTSLPSPGGLRQTSLTTHSLSDGIAGVVRGVPIRFRDL